MYMDMCELRLLLNKRETHTNSVLGHIAQVNIAEKLLGVLDYILGTCTLYYIQVVCTHGVCTHGDCT